MSIRKNIPIILTKPSTMKLTYKGTQKHTLDTRLFNKAKMFYNILIIRFYNSRYYYTLMYTYYLISKHNENQYSKLKNEFAKLKEETVDNMIKEEFIKICLAQSNIGIRYTYN